jgi:hypothetical protein
MKTMKKKERKEGRKEIGIGFDPFQLLSYLRPKSL